MYRSVHRSVCDGEKAKGKGLHISLLHVIKKTSKASACVYKRFIVIIIISLPPLSLSPSLSSLPFPSSRLERVFFSLIIYAI